MWTSQRSQETLLRNDRELVRENKKGLRLERIPEEGAGKKAFRESDEE
jgi:hypothetical protein